MSARHHTEAIVTRDGRRKQGNPSGADEAPAEPRPASGVGDETACSTTTLAAAELLKRATSLAWVLANGDVRPENAQVVGSSLHALLTEIRAAMGGSEAASSDNATHSGAASERTGPTDIPASVGVLADAIVGDALVAREHLEEVIGESMGATPGMTGLVCLVSRIGFLADAIVSASGGTPWYPNSMGWMLGEGRALDALAALKAEARP